MTRKTKGQLGAEKTVRAARSLTRRTLLKTTAAAGAVMASGPWLVKNAFSSSGEINILMW